MTTLATALLTAEEYRLIPDNGQPTELVRGRIVPVNLPFPRHGEICAQASYLLRRYLEDNPTGRVVGNDSGIVTEHDPDTVRGADVAYYSYARVPRGPLPQRYLDVVPELVIEVRSAGDRWPDILMKMAEYLEAGVTVVCILDEQTLTAHVYHAEQAPRIVTADEEFAVPDILGAFRVRVRRFFE
jgi:Uma2 family endonuclease